MAISRIGASAADGTTITIPVGHQAGDIIFIYAHNSATTAPTAPAGWTTIDLVGTTLGFRLASKIAGSSSETSGTWTNATGLIVAVYRGQATNKTPWSTPGIISGTSGTSATIKYLSSALGASSGTVKCPGTSWVLAFGAINSTTSTIETAPTGIWGSLKALTNVADVVGAASEYVLHDSNGVFPDGGWDTAGIGVGVSATWRTYSIELRAELGVPNNYQFVGAPNGISVSEKIK